MRQIKNILRTMLQRAARSALDPIVQELRSEQIDGNRLAQLILLHQYQSAISRGAKGPEAMDVGFNCFSETMEDGILLFVFACIGFTNRQCVDIGAGGTVWGSNTANLICNHGFRGLLIDADPNKTSALNRSFSQRREVPIFRPTIISASITTDNVNSILSDHRFAGEIDLLSLDIDGVDYWIWRSLDVITPRVVIVEYQDILGPDRAWTVPYSPNFNVTDYEVNRQHLNYSGAGLKALVKLGLDKGYRLVGRNRGGWNAIFVRRGIGDDALPEIDPSQCFTSEWNEFGRLYRFPLVEHMPWVEV